MAEQIITLGVGGEPENLTPFITTGLEVGAVAVVVVVCVDLTDAAVATVTLTDEACD